MPMLFSPTIGAAIRAGYWFVWVRCPAMLTFFPVWRFIDQRGFAVF